MADAGDGVALEDSWFETHGIDAMTFSATDAAFEGFRLVRRHPLTVVFWSLAYLAAFAIFFGLFASGLASIMAVTESLQGTEPTPADIEGLSQTYVAFFAVAMPLGLVLAAVLNAAVARAVIRPQDKAFGYLRLGIEELRVLAVTLVLALVFGVASIVLFAVVGVLAGLATAVNPGLGVLVGVLTGLAAAVALGWAMVRLSLAVPITVAEGRIALFDSFGLTRGHALSLFGMAVIAFIMTLLVGLLLSVVALPVTMMSGGVEQLAALEGASTAEIFRTAGPAIAGFVIVNAIASALQQAAMQGPFAAAYLGLKGRQPEA